MREWPEVPEAMRERLAAVEQISGRGVGEVFAGSHLREGCPACGDTLLFTRVYYTTDGDADVPLTQQTKREVAHEYLCDNADAHDDQYLWLAYLDGLNRWFFEGTREV